MSVAQATGSASGAPLPKTLYGYHVESRVGHGAASTIYAVSNSTGQLFALKHVVKKTEKDDRFIEQLHTEFDVSRLFRHAALRKIIEFKAPRKLFGKPNEAALIMEWVDGRPLEDHPPTSIAQVLNIFTQAAAALLSVHRLLLVHCDFKPHNILRCQADRIKLIDFGQTCKIGTAKQRVQGTPDYITPEQVKCLPVEPKTDIYSFGASMYWALTGRKVPTYFTVGKGGRDVLKRQEFPKPIELNPGVPEKLSKFVMLCVQYYPDYRPADMRVVLQCLEEIGKELPASERAATAAAEDEPSCTGSSTIADGRGAGGN